MSGVAALRRLAQQQMQRASASSSSSSKMRSAGAAHFQKRYYAADPNAPPKVSYPWKDPMNPGNWKEEHLVFVILGGWGAVIMGGKAALS
jgi:hypothetical protein